MISDVVDRAYMISKNKPLFFGSSGVLAEANRYEAALFTGEATCHISYLVDKVRIEKNQLTSVHYNGYIVVLLQTTRIIL